MFLLFIMCYLALHEAALLLKQPANADVVTLGAVHVLKLGHVGGVLVGRGATQGGQPQQDEADLGSADLLLCEQRRRSILGLGAAECDCEHGVAVSARLDLSLCHSRQWTGQRAGQGESQQLCGTKRTTRNTAHAKCTPTHQHKEKQHTHIQPVLITFCAQLEQWTLRGAGVHRTCNPTRRRGVEVVLVLVLLLVDGTELAIVCVCVCDVCGCVEGWKV